MGDFFWSDYLFSKNHQHLDPIYLQSAIDKHGVDTFDKGGLKLIDYMNRSMNQDQILVLFKNGIRIYYYSCFDKTNYIEKVLIFFIEQISFVDSKKLDRHLMLFTNICDLLSDRKSDLFQTNIKFLCKKYKNLYHCFKKENYRDKRFVYFIRNETIKTTSLSFIILKKINQF